MFAAARLARPGRAALGVVAGLAAGAAGGFLAGLLRGPRGAAGPTAPAPAEPSGGQR